MLGFTLLQGLLLFLGAAPPSAPLVAAGPFGVMFTMALTGGCSQTIWQHKVPPELQGRVFSLRMTVAGGALGVALLFVVLAGMTLVAVAMASLYPRLHRVEMEATPTAAA